MRVLRWLSGGLVFLLVLAVMAAGWLAWSFREPPLAGTLRQQTLHAGGMERSFSYYLPARLQPGAAVIFVLHGSSGTGAMMRRMSFFQFDQLADRENVVIVYPDGYQGYWNDCRRSADYAANRENIDDPAFFQEMIAYFTRTLEVDPARVYVVGLSNGGHMVYRLALEMPRAFAAFAANAASLPVDSNLDCTPAGQAVNIAVLNGTRDPINPYGGGVVTVMGNSSRGAVRSTEDTVAYWADLAGARGQAPETLPEQDGDPDTRVERVRYLSEEGIEVRRYALHGSGHVLPAHRQSPVMALLGNNAGDMQSADELWTFFNAHRATMNIRVPQQRTH